MGKCNYNYEDKCIKLIITKITDELLDEGELRMPSQHKVTGKHTVLKIIFILKV